ncbi:MAG: hypothetical protein ACUVWN_16350, partial [bacterium]
YILSHFFLPDNPLEEFLYLMGDIAFVPINVLLVTLIIDKLLSIREKRSLIEKLNMVIGTFFSEIGMELLIFFLEYDTKPDKTRENLIITDKWAEKDFSNVSKKIKNYEYLIESRNGNLKSLKSFLMSKRDFLLRLLENPNLLEHERFTDLLWSVLHLTEELTYRKDLEALPENDYKHLSNDMKRAYTFLVYEWLEYVKHLKNNYPYLFSLALRINPFNPNASPEIK